VKFLRAEEVDFFEENPLGSFGFSLDHSGKCCFAGPRTGFEVENDAMAACMQLEMPDIELMSERPGEVSEFLRSVAAASESMLLLDFDGTLAPFRVDPSTVRPWAGVRELLEGIQSTERTRIAIVTGRPAIEVSRLIELPIPLEIWGLHGAERLFPDGQIDEDELLPQQREALAEARDNIHATRLMLDLRVEEKRNSVAFHWRGKSAHSICSAQKRTTDLLSPFSQVAGMQLMHFDGGIELRAYLGDDTTDEDAFRAVSGLDGETRGLGVLVRREWRPTAARVWLRPPHELRSFFAAWRQMLQPETNQFAIQGV